MSAGCRLHWASPRSRNHGDEPFVDVVQPMPEINKAFAAHAMGDAGWVPLTTTRSEPVLVNPDWVASVTPIPEPEAF